MSERKVLNKYYPPDYDPSKIPKLKRAKDRQYVIRVMAPFNMRCKTCGNYIYKGTKFNARMETVQDENFLGLRIYRFYIKCTKCVAEITFKTDPENMDYSMEHGATRNFEAEKLIDQEEKRLQAKREADEANPMKMLEIRTRDSKREMEMMESLEELRELNQRHAGIDYDGMLRNRQETEEERVAREKEEENEEIRKIFNNQMIRRLQDDSDDEGPTTSTAANVSTKRPASDLLVDENKPSTSAPKIARKDERKKTAALLGIVRKKTNHTLNLESKPEKEVGETGSNPPNCKDESSEGSTTEPAINPNTIVLDLKSNTSGGLGLLGGYGSGSSNGSDSD
ncbi:splicing factor YJU2-like [Clavelina lepadiformis]|uniref:splicing factor YJU2-like n=1 Tax=Clavelina lepadiformis TaxID=159417 RepID=UPI004042B6E0